MQVKKFEAKTMKEALALVKSELGPDAIILSAKDMSSSHGLVGEKSVQVTAAVSEKMLQKKKVAEKNLNQDFLHQFKEAPAKKQKEFIDMFFDNMNQKKAQQKHKEAKSVGAKKTSNYQRGATRKRAVSKARAANVSERHEMTATPVSYTHLTLPTKA